MSEVLTEYDLLASRIRAALRSDLREEDFGVLALDVHAFQRRWNEPYARFCASRPTPKNWRAIPAVPQSAFKRARLSCVPVERISTTFRTSGTTGEARGEHHFRDLALYEAAALAGWDALDLPRLRQIVLAPPTEVAPHSSLSAMFGFLRQRAAQTIHVIDADGRIDFERLDAELADEKDGVLLLGTALAFLNWFEQRPHTRAVLAKSWALETGGYKGSGRELPKAELYGLIEKHLGLPSARVINEYGMTELSSQFYTRGLGSAHVGGAWIKALIIDPITAVEVAVGESGVLRIFDLANLNSVIAVETQDLAVRRAEGFELIGRDPAALPRGCSRMADELIRR